METELIFNNILAAAFLIGLGWLVALVFGYTCEEMCKETRGYGRLLLYTCFAAILTIPALYFISDTLIANLSAPCVFVLYALTLAFGFWKSRRKD